MSEVLVLLLLANIVFAVQTVGYALAAVDARVRITKVRLFSGPRIMGTSVRGVLFEVGCVPTSAHLELANRDLEGTTGALPVASRVALRLNGCFATFLLAALTLGLPQSAKSVLVGLGQVVMGALTPASYGQALVRGLLSAISGGHLAPALGTVAAKLTAVNLMPVIPLLVMDLSDRSSRRGRYAFGAVILVNVFWLILAIGWLMAIVLYLLG
jgi:hypothetical protein